jgi:OmpA-OmpF porin, OOP family
LNLVAPIILRGISKQITLQDLPVSGLRDFMREQNGYLSSSLPKGVAELIGVTETEPKKKSVTPEKTVTVKEANYAEAEPFPLKTTMIWLVGIGTAIGLGYAIWSFVSSKPKGENNLAQQIETTSTPEPVIRPIADTPKTVVTPTPPPPSNAVNAGVLLANGTTLNVPKGSFEDQLVGVLQNPSDSTFRSKWFILDKLAFDGETAILKPESMPQIQNLVTILDAYPRVSLKISGFVDAATQQVAPKLSSQRAITVFREVTRLGVSRKRLRADGLGAIAPIASNDTEEGRAKNRRVAIMLKSR